MSNDDAAGLMFFFGGQVVVGLAGGFTWEIPVVIAGELVIGLIVYLIGGVM